MPVTWLENRTEAPGHPGAFRHADGAAPVLVLRLTPHRSLSPEGFVLFFAVTCGLIAIPLIAVLGTPVLWGVLPFVVVTVGGMWLALRRSNADGALTEDLCLWSDRMALVRHNPRGPRQEWEANPFWVRVVLHATGGPVENYLTLKGGGREVELGAFLAPHERAELSEALTRALARLA
ncbi:DUF2244 domain-containing protein [Rhodobaculum claviforme]|uniref:Integral membrane protein n=1 Tax=Rhodobaculum claviforme TaxID=1549854 RepID=A0A934TKC9_9RHOB|nr:DUF2244 domain-containing protein [Rhodobaculum claviforme]MBK5927203.1 hypothetical protein [Rhodobaculum claviforme]